MLLLLDIGGTKTRLAISPDNSNFNEPTIIPTPQNFTDGIKIIKETATKLTGDAQPDAAIVGIAGSLDSAKSTIVNSPNLPRWCRQPLKKELARAMDTSVSLMNDADLAGLGEAVAGAGTDYKIVAYLTISTGIGGTRIVNKQIDHNAYGFEPGHHIIFTGGATCSCQGQGHLEAYISGTALNNKYNNKPENISDSAIWKKTTHLLAIGLHNVTVFWSPHCIVLGGSMMKSISLDHLAEHLQQTNTIFSDLPTLKLSALGETAGLHGAIAYFNSTKEI